uniref:Uncharacterized protein n=1 Tax=Tanacetum cinerariifolium TaxID=118510 RepID=A0A699JZC1_TANCI|nr:hypothetical protein [Tanacetum cinerariifolium]GFA65980.1 hypothetical protein [Tanacetum cinerariifolium]
MQIAGVAIRDTPRESMPKKKTPAKVERGKGTDLLSNASLFKASQVKEALKKIKKDSHMLHASGLGDGVGLQPKVPNEFKDKSTGRDEGTGAKLGVPDMMLNLMHSDSEKMDFDDDENINVNRNDDEEEEHEEEYSFEFDDDEEEYNEIYKDVDVQSLDTKREKEKKGDAEMTDADKNVS